MSIWIALEIDTGGPEPARVTESRNYTHNVQPMWFEALGEAVRHSHAGVPAGCAGIEDGGPVLRGGGMSFDGLPAYTWDRDG